MNLISFGGNFHIRFLAMTKMMIEFQTYDFEEDTSMTYNIADSEHMVAKISRHVRTFRVKFQKMKTI